MMWVRAKKKEGRKYCLPILLYMKAGLKGANITRTCLHDVLALGSPKSFELYARSYFIYIYIYISEKKKRIQ